jgi:NTE family protein
LEYKDMLVVDGGVVNMVPVGIVRKMGADVIIAVDVEKTPDPPKDFGSGLDTLFRVEEVQNAFIKEAQLAQADLVIRPAVGHIHWSGFGRAAELIQLGADAAAGRMDEIEALARRRTRPWDSSHPADKRLGPEWIMI